MLTVEQVRIFKALAVRACLGVFAIYLLYIVAGYYLPLFM